MSVARQEQGGEVGGRKVPAYQILAEDLRAHGVEVVFGLMSDDTAAFAVTLDAVGIEFKGARHENVAVSAADGYAAATGRTGIALIGRGPATANGLHGSVFAARGGNRVLIIYGEAPVTNGAINTLGPDYKGFNAVGVLNAAGLRTFVATSAEAARATMADALAAVAKGGAAALLLPTSVQLTELEVAEDSAPPAREMTPHAPQPGRHQAIRAAAALLERSERPLIIAGLGAHRGDAKDVLERLAEHTGAVLATTARGNAMFSGHPYNAGIIGSFSHAAGRRLIEQADCTLVFGAGLNFFTTSFGESLPEAPLVQIDRNRAAINQWTTADVSIVGDAGLVAEQLLEAVGERSADEKPFHVQETRDLLANFDPAGDFQPQNTARTLDPRTAGVELARLLPQPRNLVFDGGNFLGVVPYLTCSGPDHFKFTTDFASIGIGFGGALGFARGRPDETTVLFIGDGGFLMTMGELETAVREDLPLVIVVMNDCAYGAEVHFLRMWQLPIAKSVFPDVDYAPIAEGFGYQAATVRTVDDIRALQPLLANPDGPILIDVKLNADVAAAFMHEFHAHESKDD